MNEIEIAASGLTEEEFEEVVRDYELTGRNNMADKKPEEKPQPKRPAQPAQPSKKPITPQDEPQNPPPSQPGVPETPGR